MADIVLDPRPNLFVRVLDAAVLWVPFERTPRLFAFALIMLRQITLPFVLLFVLLLPFNKQLPSHPTIALAVGLGAFVVFEELGRFSFVRRAANPRNALILFTGMIIVTESALYYRPDWPIERNLLMRAPSWVLHVAAGLALYFGVRRRRYLVPVILAIVVAHTTFNIVTAQWVAGHRPSTLMRILPPTNAVSSARAAKSCRSLTQKALGESSMHPSQLNPITVQCGLDDNLVLRGLSRLQIGDRGLDPGERFSPERQRAFLAREQLVDVRRVPRLLCVVLVMLGIVILLPFA